MDMTLYKVGASGRVALGDLASGVEFYSAAKADDGTVTLTPVTIVTGGTKRADDETDPNGGDVHY